MNLTNLMNLKRSKKRRERSARMRGRSAKTPETRGRGSFSADAAIATAIVAFILVVLVFGAKASLRSLAGKLEVMEAEKEAILLADRLLKTCELAKCGGYLRSHEIDASKAIRIQATGSASVRGTSGLRGKASIAIKDLDDAAESAAESTENSSAGGGAGGAANKTMQRICSKRVVLLEGEEKILEACVERWPAGAAT